MAGALAILRAMRLLTWRDMNSLLSISANNSFFFIIPIAQGAAMVQGGLIALVPFVVFFFALLFVPLTADPLSKIPAARLLLWPVSGGEMVLLRAGSAVINPAFWLAILFFAVGLGWRGALLFIALAVATQLVAALLVLATMRVPKLNPLRLVPRISGRLGGIVQIALRQLLVTLDFWAALVISIGAIAYRFGSAHPEPEAFYICAMLVAIALSTTTQRLFALDGASGIDRYRLMPLRGWEIVLAKDLAFLSVLCILTALLDIGVGLTVGFAMLAIGCYPSLRLNRAQKGWRFVAGDVRYGVLQVLAALLLGVATARVSRWFLTGAAVSYVVSLVAGGMMWERNGVRNLQ